METSGVAFRSVPRLPATGVRFGGRFSRELNPGVGDSRVSVSVRPRKYSGRLSCEFSDSGHTQYYVPTKGSSLAKKKDKEKNSEIKRAKTKLKFIKRLSKDLSMLPRMADGQDLGIGLVGQVNATMISEASEVLLAQLQQLKSEQKELKRKLKLERAQRKAAAMEKSESSSSSSSESSDCDNGEVVDMTSLRINALKASEEIEAPINISLKQPEENMEAVRTVTEAATLAPSVMEKEDDEHQRQRLEEDMANSLLELENSDSSPQIRVRVPCSGLNGFKDEQVEEGSATKKIEVCMGGKCKKMGAAALLEEFERKVGAEASVVGCKCMGKCKTAPNVRVRNSSTGAEATSIEDSVKVGTNPTFTGVGLQDVDLIVANLLSKGINDEYLVLSS